MAPFGKIFGGDGNIAFTLGLSLSQKVHYPGNFFTEKGPGHLAGLYNGRSFDQQRSSLVWTVASKAQEKQDKIANMMHAKRNAAIKEGRFTVEDKSESREEEKAKTDPAKKKKNGHNNRKKKGRGRVEDDLTWERLNQQLSFASSRLHQTLQYLVLDRADWISSHQIC